MIYRFEDKNDYYVYDISSNNIFQVENPVYDILGDFEDLHKKGKGNAIPHLNKMLNKYKSIYSDDEIISAYNEIIDHRKEGIFSFRWPSKMITFSRNDIISKLDTNLDQLVLNITESCNLRCSYCVYSGSYRYERTHSRRRMSFSTAVKAIEFFLNRTQHSKFVAITFYGGEPLLNFNLIKKAVHYAKKRAHIAPSSKKLVFGLTTNLTAITNEQIDFLAHNDFGLLISLDGPTDIHDAHRKYKDGGGSHATIINNLRKIRELYPSYMDKMGYCAVVFPENIARVVDYFAHEELFNHARNFLLIVPAIDDLVVYENSLLYKIYKNSQNQDPWCSYQAAQNGRQLGDIYLESLVKLSQENRNSTFFKVLNSMFATYMLSIHERLLSDIGDLTLMNGPCIPGARKLFVNVDGNFFICEKMGESYKIGDIYSGLDIDSILSLVNRFLEISESECLNCWLLRLCSSCYVCARIGDKLSIERKKQFCIHQRNLYQQFIKIYCRAMKENPYLTTFFNKYSETSNIFRSYQLKKREGEL